MKTIQTKTLFVCASEIATFRARNPEYNYFEEQKDKFGEVVGYKVFVVEEYNKKKG